MTGPMENNSASNANRQIFNKCLVSSGGNEIVANKMLAQLGKQVCVQLVRHDVVEFVNKVFHEERIAKVEKNLEKVVGLNSSLDEMRTCITPFKSEELLSNDELISLLCESDDDNQHFSGNDTSFHQSKIEGVEKSKHNRKPVCSTRLSDAHSISEKNTQNVVILSKIQRFRNRSTQKKMITSPMIDNSEIIDLTIDDDNLYEDNSSNQSLISTNSITTSKIDTISKNNNKTEKNVFNNRLNEKMNSPCRPSEIKKYNNAVDCNKCSQKSHSHSSISEIMNSNDARMDINMNNIVNESNINKNVILLRVFKKKLKRPVEIEYSPTFSSSHVKTFTGNSEKESKKRKQSVLQTNIDELDFVDPQFERPITIECSSASSSPLLKSFVVNNNKENKKKKQSVLQKNNEVDFIGAQSERPVEIEYSPTFSSYQMETFTGNNEKESKKRKQSVLQTNIDQLDFVVPQFEQPITTECSSASSSSLLKSFVVNNNKENKKKKQSVLQKNNEVDFIGAQSEKPVEIEYSPTFSSYQMETFTGNNEKESKKRKQSVLQTNIDQLDFVDPQFEQPITTECSSASSSSLLKSFVVNKNKENKKKKQSVLQKNNEVDFIGAQLERPDEIEYSPAFSSFHVEKFTGNNEKESKKRKLSISQTNVNERIVKKIPSHYTVQQLYAQSMCLQAPKYSQINNQLVRLDYTIFNEKVLNETPSLLHTIIEDSFKGCSKQNDQYEPQTDQYSSV